MGGKVASILAIVSALAIIAGACTDEPPAPPVDRKPSATRVCGDDPFGCVRVAPGRPIRLAGLISGFGSPHVYRSAALAMKLALELRRPLLGRHVVLTRRHDVCGHQGGLSVLASDPTIVGVIGTSCSTTSELAGQILSEKGVVFVSTVSASPGLTMPAGHASFLLRTMHNGRIQGTAMAAFVRERLASRTVATVHDRSTYGKSLVSDFAAEFLEGGGQILARRSILQGRVDFRALIARIKMASADFLYAPVFLSEAALLTQQVRQTEGIEKTVLGGADGIFTPDWLEAAGPAAEGVYLSAPDHQFRDPRFDREFVPQFETRFGSSVDIWPGFLTGGFDATNLLLDAIEDVAIEEGDVLYIPRTALRDRMFATRDYPGLSGTLTCDPNGDCNHSTPVIIYQVRNGAFRKAWTWRPTG